MTIEEAREHIGDRVIYRPGPHRPWADPADWRGTITSVNGRFAFVRYGRQRGSVATDPADLELLTTAATAAEEEAITRAMAGEDGP